MSFLKVDNISFNISSFSLKNLSFSVEKGKTLALIGKSGSGKTMTLELIAGIKTPHKGRIYLDERDITHLPRHKREISIVYQDYVLFPHMNVEQNILYSQKNKPDRDLFERIVNTFKINHLLKRPVNALSGGEKQKIALARAIMSKPKLLLLDEPLSAIDFPFRRDFLDFIYHLKEEFGLTMIYVTHNFKEALTIADEAAVMFNGEIIRKGRPDEVLQNPENLETARFLGYRNILPINLLEQQKRGFFSVSPEKINIFDKQKDGCLCLKGKLKSPIDISKRYSIIDVDGYNVFVKAKENAKTRLFICFKKEDIIYLNG